MTDWQPNPGHMPVAADVDVHVWLALFEDEPPCREPIAAGKLKWMRGYAGEIAKWKPAAGAPASAGTWTPKSGGY